MKKKLLYLLVLSITAPVALKAEVVGEETPVGIVSASELESSSSNKNSNQTSYIGNNELLIEQSIIDSNIDSYASFGETITYSVQITNVSTSIAENINVRNSILETIPSYLSWDEHIETEFNQQLTSGSFKDGDYTVSNLYPGQSFSYSFDLTITSIIPNYVSSIKNTVSADAHSELVKTQRAAIDSSSNTSAIPINPTTSIQQEITESDSDGLITPGENISFMISISNPSLVNTAHNIIVRDSLLENTPDFLTINDNYTIDSSTGSTSGDLTDGTFMIDSLDPNSSVSITYQAQVADQITTKAENLALVITNDGTTPTDVDPSLCSNQIGSCSSVIATISSDSDTTTGGNSGSIESNNETSSDNQENNYSNTSSTNDSTIPSKQNEYNRLEQSQADASSFLVSNSIATISSSIPNSIQAQVEQTNTSPSTIDEFELVNAQLIGAPVYNHLRASAIVFISFLILADSLILKFRLI